MKLVFATNNPHKLAEAREIFSSKVEIMSLSDIDCHAEIPETSDTLEGNSQQKARYVFEHFGVDCFSDDTGLEVEALHGAPGVYSARYAGEPSDSARNRAKLLQALKGESNRKAWFRTVITLIAHGEEHQFEGMVEGVIAEAERGGQGFGYDSLFIPDGFIGTFAELGETEKNKISHRSRALAALWEYINHACL